MGVFCGEAAVVYLVVRGMVCNAAGGLWTAGGLCNESEGIQVAVFIRNAQ